MRVRLDERSFRMIRLEWKEERWVKVFVRDSGDFASLSWDDAPLGVRVGLSLMPPLCPTHYVVST